MANFALLLKQNMSDSPTQSPLNYSVLFSTLASRDTNSALLCVNSYGGSFCSLSGLLPCTVSKGPSSEPSAFLLCSALLSCTPASELHPLWPLWTPGLIPPLRETSGLCCGALSRSCNQLGQAQDSTHLFSFSLSPLPCSA